MRSDVPAQSAMRWTGCRFADGTSSILTATAYGPDGAPDRIFSPFTVPGAPTGTFLAYSEAGLARTHLTNTDWGQTYTDTYNAAGLQTSSWVRPEGLETLRMDPNGQTTLSRSTIFGDLAWAQDASGATTTYSYNARGQQVGITDPAQNVIATYYENWETSPTRLVDPDLGTMTYTYDNAGRLDTVTDARGHTTTVNYKPNTSLPEDVTFGSSTVASWGHAPSGRLTSSVFNNLDTNGTSRGTVTKTYGYDTRGRMNTTTWAIPGLPGGPQTISYTHQESGAINTATLPNGDVLDYTYNTRGQPTGLTRNGTVIADGAMYNARGQLTSVTTGTPSWPVTDHAVFARLADYEDWSARSARTRAVGVDQATDVEDHLTRLYRAVLGRNPDPGGWVYWMTLYATGTPSATIARAFAESVEYTNTWTGYIDSHTSHGLPNGSLVTDASLLADDVARFGDIPGVHIHDLPSMSSAQVREILDGPGTIIGGFCDSGACLAGFGG